MTVEGEGMWIIGYGSLIFKPPPLVSFKVTGYIEGYIRRFWQSSSDHRGTPENPGRVVTLIPLADLISNPDFSYDLHRYELLKNTNDVVHTESIDVRNLEVSDLKVWGCAYYISPENVKEVKEYLDVREQDGYTTHVVPFMITSYPQDNPLANKVLNGTFKGDVQYITSSIYIGTKDNESFVGPEDIKLTASTIKQSKGPSGENLEYLAKLADSVKDLDKIGGSGDHYLADLLRLAEAPYF